MKKICLKSFGFTLIELLVVVSVIGLLFTVGIASYQEFNRKQTVSQSAKNVISGLRLAQSKAISGEKDSSKCGNPLKSRLNYWSFSVLSGNKYQIQGNCTNNDAKPPKTITFSTQEFSLPSNVSLSSPEIRFLPFTQGVNQPASLCLSGYNNTYFYKISVTSTGEIKDEGFTNSCP